MKKFKSVMQKHSHKRGALSIFLVYLLIVSMFLIFVIPQVHSSIYDTGFTCELDKDVYFMNFDLNLSISGITPNETDTVTLSLYNNIGNLIFSDTVISENNVYSYSHSLSALNVGYYKIVANVGEIYCITQFTYLETSNWVGATFPISVEWKGINYTLFSNRTLLVQKDEDWISLTFPTFDTFSGLVQTFTRNSMVFRANLFKSGQLDADLCFALTHKGLKFFLNGTQNSQREFDIIVDSSQPLLRVLNGVKCGNFIFDYSDLVKTGVSFTYSSGILSVNCGKSFFVDPAIFEDGFEDGTFDAWTAQQVDGSSTLVPNDTNPFDGTYNARGVIASGGWAYTTKQISETDIVYMRCYISLSDMPSVNDENIALCAFRDTTTSYGVTFSIQQISGEDYWVMSIEENDIEYHYYEATASNPNIDTYHCVEMLYDVTHQQCALWVNGTQLILESGRSLVGGAIYCHFGCRYSPDFAATVRLDSCVVATEYIGPAIDYYPYIQQVSDIDTQADVGSHSDFTKQQTEADSSYDILTESNTGVASNSTLIDDGFESGDGNWDGNGASGWSIVTQYTASGETIQEHGGSNFVVFPENTANQYMRSDDLDMSTASGIYISFWFYDDDLDTSTNDFHLDLFDGSVYNDYHSLAGDTESQWHYYTVKVTDSQYFKSNFRVEFNCTAGNNEAGGIDDVVIIRETTSLNYRLELEEQFTEVPYEELSSPELHVVAGDFSDAETLSVQVWNGTWNNLGTVTESDETVFDVADYVDSANLYIKFIDGTQSSDAVQSTWQIDSVWLEEGVAGEEYFKDAAQSIGVSLSSAKLTDFTRIITQSITSLFNGERLFVGARVAAQSISASFSADKFKELSRSVSQSIATSLSSNRLGEFTRTISQSVTVSLNSSKLSDLSRSVSQTITASINGTNVVEFFRIASQSVNTLLNANKVSDFIRGVTQSVSTLFNGEIIGEFLRNVSQSIAISISSNRLGEILRNVSQSINISLDGGKFNEFFIEVSQSINMLFNTNKTMVFVRTITQNIVSSFNGYRIIEVSKLVTQSISISLNTNKVINLVREVTQNIETSLNINRVANFFRVSSQTLGLIIDSNRIGDFFKEATQNIATSFSGNRLFEIIREVTQNINTSINATKISDIIRNVSQTINITFDGNRLLETLRTATQSITATMETGKISEFFRGVSQTINIGFSTVAQFTSGIVEYFRTASLNINIGLSTITQLIPAIDEYFRTASLSVSVEISSVAQQVGIFIRNVTLSISTAFESSRLIDVFRTATQSISVGLESFGGIIEEFFADASLAIVWLSSVTWGSVVMSDYWVIGFIFCIITLAIAVSAVYIVLNKKRQE